jgi:hypothetical protein
MGSVRCYHSGEVIASGWRSSVEEWTSVSSMPMAASRSVPIQSLPRDQVIRDAMIGLDPPDGTGLDMIHKGMNNGGFSGILQSKIPLSGLNPNTNSPWAAQDLINELNNIHVLENS